MVILSHQAGHLGERERREGGEREERGRRERWEGGREGGGRGRECAWVRECKILSDQYNTRLYIHDYMYICVYISGFISLYCELIT